MGKKNTAIDAYISKSQPFAKPILKRLRGIIHKGCPKVIEDIKWGAPFYLYQDRVLCATMGFKKHGALIFWKSALIKKERGAKAKNDLKVLRKISSLKDLPAERVLLSYIQLAMHFNEPTTKLPPREKRSVKVTMPTDFARALRASARAQMRFKAFTPSKKKDYIFWITGAKTESTRTQRIETAVKWIAMGRSRNWKYEASKAK
jgi:uncharacterized protein YdeI (YjbR/CyaY-like superfamily)